MVRLDELTRRVDAVADELARASATVNVFDPGGRAFGCEAPGPLGALGRALHHQLCAGLTARGWEASAHGARLAELADAVRLVAVRYDTVDLAQRERGGSTEPIG